jgi:hypothetical protein
MKITRDQLDEYARLTAERKELDKRSRTLSDHCKQIEKQAQEELEAAGKLSCKRFGYQLALISGRVSVPWKDHFIREVGTERANALQNAASENAPHKITITPPAA